MSYFDYKSSQSLAAQNPPFYALIMAAMRQADSHNAIIMRLAWPEVWDELQKRYNAPGGFLSVQEAEKFG